MFKGYKSRSRRKGHVVAADEEAERLVARLQREAVAGGGGGGGGDEDGGGGEVTLGALPGGADLFADDAFFGGWPAACEGWGVFLLCASVGGRLGRGRPPAAEAERRARSRFWWWAAPAAATRTAWAGAGGSEGPCACSPPSPPSAFRHPRLLRPALPHPPLLRPCGGRGGARLARGGGRQGDWWRRPRRASRGGLGVNHGRLQCRRHAAPDMKQGARELSSQWTGPWGGLCSAQSQGFGRMVGSKLESAPLVWRCARGAAARHAQTRVGRRERAWLCGSARAAAGASAV